VFSFAVSARSLSLFVSCKGEVLSSEMLEDLRFLIRLDSFSAVKSFWKADVGVPIRCHHLAPDPHKAMICV